MLTQLWKVVHIWNALCIHFIHVLRLIREKKKLYSHLNALVQAVGSPSLSLYEKKMAATGIGL
jgi:hypothetical protein